MLPDMSKLTNLQELNLNDSRLIKAIPSLYHLVSLEKMEEQYEILEGEYNVEDMTKLGTIDVME